MSPFCSQARKRARILIVDDHPMIRERLREVIEAEPDLSVCGEAGDRAEAMQLLSERKPDLALVDLTLRNSHGLDLIKEALAADREVSFLVVSMHEDGLYAERALQAGARGYINKHEATHHVLEAIRTVLNGGLYLSSSRMSILTAKLSGRRGPLNLGTDTLTDRELSVFELLGRGYSTREIAQHLALHMRTVETYRARIKKKLHLDGAHALLQHAIRWTEGKGVGRSMARQEPR